MLQLLRAHRRRAELAHHDARGGVGDPHGLLERPAGGVREGQGGDHRVPRAGDVEHLPRFRRHARMAALRPHQHHAALGAGAEQRRQSGRAHRGAGGGHHLGFRAGRQTRRAREFAGVGGEAVGAAVEAEIVALRVGENRDARLARRPDGARDHRRRQRALGVVRQDQRLAAGHPAPHRLHQRRGFPCVGRPRLLLVQPRDLLVAGDDPHLAGAAARRRCPHWRPRWPGRRRGAPAARPPRRPPRASRRAPPCRRGPRRFAPRCRPRPAWRGCDGAAPPAPALPARSGPPRRRGSGRASRRRGRARGRRRNRAWARYAPRSRRKPARPGGAPVRNRTACPGLEDLRREIGGHEQEEEPTTRPTTAPRAGAR